MPTGFGTAKAAIDSAYFIASNIRITYTMTPIVGESALTYLMHIRSERLYHQWVSLN